MIDFKALFDAWRGKGLISEMFGQFEEMLGHAGAMFKAACDVMWGRSEVEGTRESLRAIDKQINRTQRTIRRQLVEHLTLNPGADVPASLVLMSIVKDAERLGDYARDIFAAWQMSPDAIKNPKYAPSFQKVEAEVSQMLSDTRKALAESDEALANDVMAREDGIKAECDKILSGLTHDTLRADETVSLAILSRYYRRITAHTANIASSVTNPVEWLDYKSKNPTA